MAIYLLISMVWKDQSKRRKGQQRMKWLDSITDSVDMNLSKHLDIVKDRGAWWAAVHGVSKSWTQLRNWKITYRGETQENWLTHQNGQNPHLKYCLQLKNKDVRRGGLGTLEEMNAIHMEIENKCVNKGLLCHAETIRNRVDSAKLLGITTSSYTLHLYG